MGRPKLALQVPADHTITIPTDGVSHALLCGTLSFNNVPPQCEIRIMLARVGRLKRIKETKNDVASRMLMRELGFMGSVQRQECFDSETAEKLCSRCITLSQRGTGSRTSKCRFDLPIPSFLPATAVLPSVDVSYAVLAECNLPNGKVLRTSQDLRIIRKTAGAVRLEPIRTVSFPETSFAVRASFGLPSLTSRHATFSTTLQLNSLKLPITSSMRVTETRWLVPREIRWELEETATIVLGCPDATGHIPMSSMQRLLNKRRLASGVQKLKLKYPFTRPGNTPVTMLPDGSGLSTQFTVSAPKDIELSGGTALAVAGRHILHTVLDESTNAQSGLQKRFAVHLGYKLHVWLRIGEDVFVEKSGDLVNRKMDEMAYTVVCPLTMSQTPAGQQNVDEEEPTPIIPPSYDGVWEQPPPDYLTPSNNTIQT